MAKIFFSAGLIAAAATLSGCAASETRLGENGLEPWQEARVVGTAESCIPLRSIRNTRVHDDRTIDFHMNNGRIYRNTLPYDCGNLGFEEAFSYETSLSRLCSTDIITVLQQPIRSGLNGPRCGLGEFTPIELAGRG